MTVKQCKINHANFILTQSHTEGEVFITENKFQQ